jgi:hypothetical protein
MPVWHYVLCMVLPYFHTYVLPTVRMAPGIPDGTNSTTCNHGAWDMTTAHPGCNTVHGTSILPYFHTSLVWLPPLILVVLVYIPYGDRRWYLHCITGSVLP